MTGAPHSAPRAALLLLAAILLPALWAGIATHRAIGDPLIGAMASGMAALTLVALVHTLGIRCPG